MTTLLTAPPDVKTWLESVDDMCDTPHAWYAVQESSNAFTVAKASVEHAAQELLCQGTLLERILQVENIRPKQGGTYRIVLRDTDELKPRRELANMNTSIYPDYTINNCLELFVNGSHSYKGNRSEIATVTDTSAFVIVAAHTYGPKFIEEIERATEGEKILTIDKKI